jgi:hypothetical protein
MRHPTDEVLRLQVEVFRRMTPEQKLGAVYALQWSAWAFRAAGIALRRPELPVELPGAASRDAFLHGSA